MITAEMLTQLTTGVTSSITTILPAGMTILAATIGVGIIPRIIYKFL